MSTSLCGGLRLDGLLARAALTHPQREGVIFNDTSWTYAEVHDRACRLAGALAKLGVGKGDRVALWTSNRPEFVEILFGVSQLGAIAATMDHWWTWSDACPLLEKIRPKVLIMGPSQAAFALGHADAIEAAGIKQVLCLDGTAGACGFDVYEHHLKSATPLRRPTPVEPEDPAVIFFTSGSTGRSKGAVHTHRSLVSAAMIMSLELRLKDGERTLHFLPLFSSCMEHLIPLTLMRATHIILPKFDAPTVWQAVKHHEVTHFNAIPTTLRRMLEVVPEDIPQSLRCITYASETMPVPLITALIERLPDVDFVQFYGMTEQLCLTVLDASEHLRKAATIGHPMMGAELYLVDPEGNVTAGGTPGEIVARSPTLFSGYWEDESATTRVMLGNSMRTGDIGCQDEEGYMLLEGRIKEMIKTGGATVIPSEIEGILMGHPKVNEAAVVGIPDEHWGEAVHAFVTLTAGASITEGELKLFCRDQLASYKTPKAIHVVKELPRTGIGKIARRQVRDQILAREKTA